MPTGKEYSMKPETASVHAGTRLDPNTRGVNTPIYTSSAFDYRVQEEPVYPRLFNTVNQQAVVAKLAALESAEDGVLFSSGMGAISTVFLTLLKAGDHVVLQDQRSEEHTSELQSRPHLVCRLLLEKKIQALGDSKRTLQV